MFELETGEPDNRFPQPPEGRVLDQLSSVGATIATTRDGGTVNAMRTCRACVTPEGLQ